MKFLQKYLLCIIALVFSVQASAVLEITITKSSNTAQPIAVVPFGWGEAGAAPENIAGVVAADLERSGQFKALPEADMLAKPASGQTIRWENWRAVGVDHLVVGKLRKVSQGRFAVDVQLFDVARAKQLLGHSFPVSESALRRTAHHIADLIYEELTGVKGAFSTRIAFVSVERKRPKQATYKLQVADADGYNPRTVVKSASPILSPSWSPDGTYLAYVSFRNRQAEVFAINLRTGKEQKLAGFDGVNGAPVFSPDGNKLAMALSRAGNPDIYVLDMKSRDLKQITRGYAIETEPAWSPDGQNIIYTSGRTGSPQLYEVSASGGQSKRITYDGNYNASATVSPDGRHVAMVHAKGGRYQIGVLDRKKNFFRVLTEGGQEESPSFAPNGQMLIYATQVNGRGVLSAVSLDGRTRQQLLLTEGDIREPAWSPFNN